MRSGGRVRVEGRWKRPVHHYRRLSLMRRFLLGLVLLAVLFGSPYAALVLNQVMGSWSATAIEQDGSVTQMTKTLRKCIRMSKIATLAIIISWPMTSVSVSMAPWIKRVRS